MKEVFRHQTSSVPTSGPVAQLGARFHGMEEVVGSIPTRSTILNPPRINHFQTVCANRTKIVQPTRQWF